MDGECTEANSQPTSDTTGVTNKTKYAENTEKHHCDTAKEESVNNGLRTKKKHFSYRLPGQHYYNGVMWNYLVPEERLKGLETFEVKSSDVILSGYPKSGTTWLEEIIYLIQSNCNVEQSNSIPIYIRVPYLESDYAKSLIDDMAPPRIYKTHLYYRMLPKQVYEKQPKIVHIIRDPRDIAVSYYNFYRSLLELGRYTGTWDEFLDMFMAGYVCCGEWFEYVAEWWQHRDDANVLILRYEEMKHDLRSAVLRIAEFLDKTLNEEQLNCIVERTSFEYMKKNPMLNFENASNINSSISPFMRKGETGDWKNYFSSTQLQTFNKLLAGKLSSSTGLHFDDE